MEVLGFDCAACRKTFRLIEQTARDLGIAIRLEKVDNPARIATLQALRLPAVAVNGRLVHSGGVPSQPQIRSWLSPQHKENNDN